MDTNMPAASNSESESNATVTIDLVKRVSRRVAIGIPLELAIAGEGITSEDYQAYLDEHTELAVLVDVAKCRFIEYAIAALLAAKNPSSNIRWFLERLYPEEFGEKRGKEKQKEREKPCQTIAGVPEELVIEARRQAQRFS
jgi:hypothetical protein